MANRKIAKSFKLDSEPVLHWPMRPAQVVVVPGYRLHYPGKGLTYSLRRQESASVQMVGWDINVKETEWRNLFSQPELDPKGLRALAPLRQNCTAEGVCGWISRNGLLGFRQEPDSETNAFHPMPLLVNGGRAYSCLEPLDCIRKAAERAVNALALWSALKKSYARHGPESEQAIRSILTIKEDSKDYKMYNLPIQNRVFVNGEPRSHRLIPRNPREWRYLANVLLAEYIQDHIWGEIQVGLGIQRQNKDDDHTRMMELPPDWNVSPTWRIQSALAAYYVELLMVMRRFRSCKVCGKDISHQRETSIYCRPLSTCRSIDCHRKKAAKKKGATV